MHVYDIIRDPLPDHGHRLTVHYDRSFEVYARFWNMAVTVGVVTLAVIVHFQQQCKNGEVTEMNSDDDLNEKLLS